MWLCMILSPASPTMVEFFVAFNHSMSDQLVSSCTEAAFLWSFTLCFLMSNGSGELSLAHLSLCYLYFCRRMQFLRSVIMSNSRSSPQENLPTSPLLAGKRIPVRHRCDMGSAVRVESQQSAKLRLLTLQRFGCCTGINDRRPV